MESQTPTQPSGANSTETSDERSPLLSAPELRPRAPRSVTFSANPVSHTIEPQSFRSHQRQGQNGQGTATRGPTPSTSLGGPPMLAALNSKLRRRNSHTAVTTGALIPALGPKIGPQRSTKKTEKLKLLPNPEVDEDGQDEESGRDVYSQYTRIKDPTARRDAARLGKADRDRLPRVTAYCTANRYEMDGLIRFLKSRGKSRGANPKLIDECIYTPYDYTKARRHQEQHHRNDQGERELPEDPVQVYERRHSTGGEAADETQTREDLIELRSENATHIQSEGYSENAIDQPDIDNSRITSEELLGPVVSDDGPITASIPDFDIQVHTPEVFLFDYGVVVIWGMSEAQETKFLKEIAKFELEKLAPDDVETEHFNFYYTREYQARIYNDFITLRDKNNYMTKLAISHALAQSVKVRSEPKYTCLSKKLLATIYQLC